MKTQQEIRRQSWSEQTDTERIERAKRVDMYDYERGQVTGTPDQIRSAENQ